MKKCLIVHCRNTLTTALLLSLQHLWQFYLFSFPPGCEHFIILCWVWWVYGRNDRLGQSMGSTCHWSCYISHLTGCSPCWCQMGRQTATAAACYTNVICFGFLGWHFCTYRLWWVEAWASGTWIYKRKKIVVFIKCVLHKTLCSVLSSSVQFHSGNCYVFGINFFTAAQCCTDQWMEIAWWSVITSLDTYSTLHGCH